MLPSTKGNSMLSITLEIKKGTSSLGIFVVNRGYLKGEREEEINLVFILFLIFFEFILGFLISVLVWPLISNIIEVLIFNLIAFLVLI